MDLFRWALKSLSREYQGRLYAESMLFARSSVQRSFC
ncbi:hypothetical protein AGRO_2149 [Agrobacterium sp. ATCC 31749]|nr:hypothetical protein AGRO_2149 [Agrobacterium sp. ATCC 31749]